MAKIVYNTCYGGFSLSQKAVERYFELKDWKLERDDPILVQVVEELGKEANGNNCELAICELPAGTRYRIVNEYEGMEGMEIVLTEDEAGWRIAQ